MYHSIFPFASRASKIFVNSFRIFKCYFELHRLNIRCVRVLSSKSTNGYYIFSDICYYRNDQLANHKHELDIYIQAKSFPREKQDVVIFCHGGSWARGDRRHPYAPDVLYGNIGKACASEGLVAVIISYRLAPAAKHPDQVNDVARAIAWVHSNIENYGGNPEKIVIIGHSAGAHLASLCLSCSQWLKNAGMNEHSIPNIRAFVGISGIYDLKRLAANPVGRSLVEAAFGEDPCIWEQASPLNIINNAYSNNRSLCPLLNLSVLLISAERDFHLDQDTTKLHSALLDAHIDGSLNRIHYRNEDHFSLVLKFGDVGNSLTSDVIKFIKSV